MGRNLESSVIRLLDKNGEIQGTGFLLSETIAITCAHVVAACQCLPGDFVGVVFHSTGLEGRLFVLQVFTEEGKDIAVLELQGEKEPQSKPVILGRTLGISGDECIAFGFPYLDAIQGIEGRGKIYKIIMEAGQPIIQLASHEITTGFSGAPLFGMCQ